MIFQVSYTVKCKPGWIFKKEFKFSYPMVMASFQAVEDDIFDFVNAFPWKVLEFESYSDPDIRLINDQPSNSEVIRTTQAFEKQFIPQARRMHQKNGTLGNNNSGGGNGFQIPKSAKLAGLAYAGYKVGKSNVTG
jgi:hypothetical protein